MSFLTRNKKSQFPYTSINNITQNSTSLFENLGELGENSWKTRGELEQNYDKYSHIYKYINYANKRCVK